MVNCVPEVLVTSRPPLSPSFLPVKTHGPDHVIRNEGVYRVTGLEWARGRSDVGHFLTLNRHMRLPST